MKEPITYRIKHVGINAGNNKGAQEILQQLTHYVGLERGRESEEKVFAGELIELMKSSNVGKNGHIGLQTKDVELAMQDLTAKGITFREDTIRRDERGRIVFAYLEQEMGGFAFHLME